MEQNLVLDSMRPYKCEIIAELQFEMFKITFVGLHIESDFYLTSSLKAFVIYLPFRSFLRVTCTLWILTDMK